jgi:hypothetical protein
MLHSRYVVTFFKGTASTAKAVYSEVTDDDYDHIW